MRILLSTNSKKELFNFLKNKHNCNSINELSRKLKIPVKTLDSWFYLENRLIPEEFIEKDFISKLKILDKRPENWGQVMGGKKIYKKTINQFGIGEIKRRQSLGGKNAAKTKSLIEEKNFSIDLKNPLFLEFYGSLLGDGWLTHLENKNKWIIGMCGNLSLDKEYIHYLRKNIKELFKREGYIYENPKGNVIEFIFRHKLFFKFLSNDLNFPIGKKINLKINHKIYSMGFEYVKYVIKGIFDTDGSFYLDNHQGKNPYPCINIHMKSPELIKQIGDILLKEGFSISYSDNNYLIRLSGKKQLNKWIEKIGSSNKRNLNKLNNFLVSSAN